MMRRLPLRARAHDGFTLVEMLVSVVVIGIFFAMFSVVVTSTLHHSAVIEEQTVLQTEARSAADSLVGDLRQASSGIDGTCPISVATATSLQFLSPDKAQPSHQRTVAVQLAGGQLRRAVTSSTNTAPPWTGMWTTPPANAWKAQVPIANSTVFSYYDAGGAVIAAPVAAGSLKSIRAVGITLATEAKGSNGRQTSYDTRATFRVTSC